MDAASPTLNSSPSPPSPEQNGPLNPYLQKTEINKTVSQERRKYLTTNI